MQPNEMDTGRAELLAHGMVYFDTSTWNRLADHTNPESEIASLRKRGAVILGSVFSAGEILKTPDPGRRQRLCAVMDSLLGDRALLERPMALARGAAEAVLRGDAEVLLRETGPGRTMRAFLRHPEKAAGEDVATWLGKEDDNLEEFRARLEPATPSRTRFHSPAVLDSDAFLRLLLKSPPAVELGLTLSQVRDLCGRSDIWRAVAGTLASIVAQVLTRSPKKKGGHRRPGAPDLWQAVYLGVVEVFVTGDVRQLEAVSEVSALLRHPRCVVDRSAYLAGLEPAAGPRCRVCGCVLAAAGVGGAGLHARVVP